MITSNDKKQVSQLKKFIIDVPNLGIASSPMPLCIDESSSVLMKSLSSEVVSPTSTDIEKCSDSFLVVALNRLSPKTELRQTEKTLIHLLYSGYIFQVYMSHTYPGPEDLPVGHTNIYTYYARSGESLTIKISHCAVPSICAYTFI